MHIRATCNKKRIFITFFCRKILIYQIKVVPLHRQKQIGEADNRQDAAFFIVHCVSKKA